MRIAIWKTGHEIADTVAQHVAQGLLGYENTAIGYCTTDRIDLSKVYDANIGYGILRGAEAVFKESDRSGIPWFNIDRGYFGPSHFDGYYRISLRGTQQTTGLDKLTPDYDRWRALGIELKPWRGFDDSKPVLVIPPTEHVLKFFSLDDEWKASLPLRYNYYDKRPPGVDYVIRTKADKWPINFDDYSHVVTFNSSVGWQALAAGIPCISDPKHSIVGAWFKDHKLSESLEEAQYKDRERLFATMSGLQLTLDEMRAGKLWPLLSRLMSISVGTPEKNAQAM